MFSLPCPIFPGRKFPISIPTGDLRPVSGVSLRPVLENKDLDRPEPIHLQFSTDYGLRDGDWKLVSFKGQEWELYNLANDRAETVNLAKSEPERLAAMVAKWKEMSKNVLRSEKLANPKMKPAENPKSNREWTVFSDSEEPPTIHLSRKKRPGSNHIRARKNTEINRRPDSLELTFTGEDPGLAMDLRSTKDLAKGPYRLTFELTTNWKGSGDIFYTTDPKTILPKGTSIQFPINGSNTAQAIDITLDTDQVIRQLRVDVSDGVGSAIMKRLQLQSKDGTVLKDWTPGKKTTRP